MGLSVTNNLSITYGRNSVKNVFTWIADGSKVFLKRPLLHLLTTLFLSLWFVIILFVGKEFQESYILLMICYMCFSFILPIIMASLTTTNEIASTNLRGVNYFKYIAAKILNSGCLNLIIIYVLIEVAVYLATGLLIQALPSFEVGISVLVKVLLIYLQIISWVAVPACLNNENRVRPFHLLWYSCIGIIKNFIPTVLYVVLNIVTLLLLTFVIGSLGYIISAWSILIFMILMWIFLSWFGICCAQFSRSIIIDIN